jgi:hypothetical protein
LDVFVWKIDPRFDPGQKVQKSFPVGHEVVAQFSGESPLSGKQGALRAGVKHIEDSFRTGQVDAAMKKGSFGKLSRSGHPRAKFADRLKKCFNDQGISVAGNFQQILTRVGLGIGPKSEHCLVQVLILKLKANGKGMPWREVASREFLSDRKCMGTAQTD